MFAVCYPYIRAKLDSICQELERTFFEGRLDPRKNTKSYNFLQIYPYVSALLDLYKWYFQLKFSSGRSAVHSPLLKAIGLCLLRDDSDELEQSWGQKSRMAQLVTKGLTYALTAGAFGVHFLDYWYAREDRRSTLRKIPIPPAPKKLTTDKISDRCPICSLPRKNDSILSTSGYVFCNYCITQFMRVNKRCPVTGYPSNESHIVPIFAFTGQ